MRIAHLSSSAAAALLVASSGGAAAAESSGTAMSEVCEALVDRGEEAVNPSRNVAAAFALWREASAACDALDLEPVVAAKLLSSQSLLPENAARAEALLDAAVSRLDRNDPDHAEAMANVLQRRSSSEAYADTPLRVEADLQTIVELRTERFGKGSPEALAAEVNLLTRQAWTLVRSRQFELGRTKVAALEALTKDGAGGAATLTRDSLLTLHSSLLTAYELLGDAKESERHRIELGRLVHLQGQDRESPGETAVPVPDVP